MMTTFMNERDFAAVGRRWKQPGTFPTRRHGRWENEGGSPEMHKKDREAMRGSRGTAYVAVL